MKSFYLALFIICLYPRQSISQSSLQAEESFTTGHKLYKAGYYDSAITYLRKAKTSFKNQNDLSGQIKAAYAMGESMANLGQCEMAIDQIETALDKAKTELSQDSEAIAEGYYYLGRAYGGCGRQYEKAVALLHKSITLKSSLFGDHAPQLAYDFTFLGYCFNAKSEYDSAQYFLQKALKIRQEENQVDEVELSHTLFFLAKVKANKSDLAGALSLNKQVLKLRTANLRPDHPTVSNSLNEIGNLYRKYGNYDQALAYYKQALEMRKRSLGSNHTNVAGSYYTIGNLYGTIANYHEAIRYIEEGNRIMTVNYGYKSPVLFTYIAYAGKMYSQTGNHKMAKRLLLKSQDLAEKYLDEQHPYRAIIYDIISDYYGERQDTVKQVAFLKRAISIYRKAYGINTIREADALVKLGDIYNEEQASDYYNKAAQIYLERLGTKNSNLARAYLKFGTLYQGKPYEALNYFKQALIALIPDSTISIQHLPDISMVRDKALGLSIMQKLALTLFTKYRLTKDQQAIMASLTCYKYAVELIDAELASYNLELSKSQLQKESNLVFQQAVNTAYELFQLTRQIKYKEEAFSIVEKSKSPLLLSKIQDNKTRQQIQLPDSISDIERDLKIEIAYYKKQRYDVQANNNDSLLVFYKKRLFDTQNEYEHLKEEIEERYPAYFNFNYNHNVSTLTQVRQSLGMHEVLLEYFGADTLSYSFLITQNSIEINRQTITRGFNQALSDYRKSLSNNTFIVNNAHIADSLYCTSAYKLYDFLMKRPVSKLPSTINHLVIVPDVNTSEINFGTFLTHQLNTWPVDYQKLDYLLNKYTISYAYSSTLKSNLSAFNGQNAFGGFAPSYKVKNYSNIDSSSHPMTFTLVRDGNLPLPGAIEEVNLINDLMMGKSWTNEEASETNFKSNAINFGVIHLAMHSLLNTDDPEYSELLFNNEKDTLNDGFLNIDEIYNLKLKANLVVLSACSSGAGKLQEGEGPISFSRAFSYAGCPSVVMTMWKIPDEATRQIMVGFYKRLLEGKDKAKALQEAQLAYLKQTEDPAYQHPFYWASFVTMGNTQPIIKPKQQTFYLVFLICALLITTAVIGLRYYKKVS